MRKRSWFPHLIRRLCLRDALFLGHCLCSPSPPRDQPAQGVHGQGNEEGQHQVPQYNPRQHTRAHHGAVAFWECMWHWGQGRSMGVGNWEEVSVGFGEIWEETEMRNREGNFRI